MAWHDLAWGSRQVYLLHARKVRINNMGRQAHTDQIEMREEEMEGFLRFLRQCFKVTGSKSAFLLFQSPKFTVHCPAHCPF